MPLHCKDNSGEVEDPINLQIMYEIWGLFHEIKYEFLRYILKLFKLYTDASVVELHAGFSEKIPSMGASR